MITEELNKLWKWNAVDNGENIDVYAYYRNVPHAIRIKKNSVLGKHVADVARIVDDAFQFDILNP